MTQSIIVYRNPAEQAFWELMAWECNECGSQEYTMAVSESDIQHLGCAGCGSDEFHKAVARD